MLEVVCVEVCVGVCEVHPYLYVCMRAQRQMGTEVGVFKTWRAITNGFVCLYTHILASMCVCVCLCNVVIIRVYIHHVPSQSALAGSGVVTISEG